MTTTPWWIARAQTLESPADLAPLSVGELWRLRERLEFLHRNVEPKLLEIDLAAHAHAAEIWERMQARTQAVAAALELALGTLAQRMTDHAAFSAHWRSLGFARHADSGGTPADDFLDAMFHLSRLESGDERSPEGNLNLSSRAERIADFLDVMRPGANDVVFDLGSGGGKVALTVAASTECHVHGVELEPAWVEDSQRAARRYSLDRTSFTCSDVREVDFSAGTIFYLYHPFRGSVAAHVANALAQLARKSPIRLYVAGPALDFGEHFLTHVDSGAWSLIERRGEFDEAMVLRSPRNETGSTP